MKLSDFNIDLNKHSEDHFQLQFTLNEAFFALKENSLFQDCAVEVKLDCDRVETTVTLRYELKGVIKADCERCLKPIELKVDSTYVEAIQMTSDVELLKEELYISENHPVISIYDSLYEHLCIETPNRLICENAIEQEECEIPANAEQEKEIDPRWDKLKNLIK